MGIFAGNRDLLDAFRRGDGDALVRVYEEYFDSVAAITRRGFTIESQGHVYVQGAADPQTHEDLIQEVFVRAFAPKARAAYDGLQPYRPYLLRIGKNLLIDRHRAKKRRPETSLESLANAGDHEGVGAIDRIIEANAAFEQEPPPAPEDRIQWERDLERTQAYLDALDPRLREFVHLRFEQDLSQYEIADRMKLSRWKVRRMEERVRRGLQRHLSKARR